MATRKIQVEIVGDTSDLERAFSKASRSGAGFNKQVSRSSGALGTLGKAAAFAGGAAALGGLAVAVKAGIGEWQETTKVAAQTEAVLKSTGGVANVTAKQVDDLATSLLRKSGVDDEQIKTGANMLLTFTRIRNEVGAGNDIFDQATKATLNLSVAMGKDMRSSALLVGKALNDPIKGMTALSRAGIQFTADQKETVKALVETGETAKAQKIILKELETQFGGSAEAIGKTLPGQIAIARESLNNFAGDIVAKVVPAIADAVNFVRAHWPDVREAIVNAWRAIQPTLRDLKEMFDLVKDTIEKHSGTIMRNLNAMKVVVVDALKIVRDAIKLVNALLHGEWGEAWKAAQAIVTSAIDGIKTLLGAQLENVKALALALGRAAYNGLKDGVTGIGEFFLETISGLKDMLTNQLADMRTRATNFGKAILAGIVSGITGVGAAVWEQIRGIKTRVDEAIETVRGWGTSLGSWIKNAAVAAITGLPEALWNVIAGFPKLILERAKEIAGWGADIGRAIVDAILDEFEGLPGKIIDKISSIKGPSGKDIAGAVLGRVGIGDVAAGFNSAAAARLREMYAQMTPTAGSAGGLAPQTAGLLATIQRTFGGVSLTSGYRSPAENAAVQGAPNSDHLTGRAIDLVPTGGWTPATIALFDRIAAWAATLGNVRWIGWRGVRGHGPYDHLHISTFDQGGWLPPKSKTLAINNTRYWEPVGPPGRGGGGMNISVTVNGWVGNDQDLAGRVVDAINRQQRVGRLRFSG